MSDMSDDEATRYAAALVPDGMTFRNKDEMYARLTSETRKRQGGGPLPMVDRHQLWRIACRIWMQGSACAV